MREELNNVQVIPNVNDLERSSNMQLNKQEIYVMNKKIYNSPTASIVSGSELLQNTPPVNFGSGTLDGDEEGSVLGKENDTLDDDEEEENDEKAFSFGRFRGVSGYKWTD